MTTFAEWRASRTAVADTVRADTLEIIRQRDMVTFPEIVKTTGARPGIVRLAIANLLREGKIARFQSTHGHLKGTPPQYSARVDEIGRCEICRRQTPVLYNGNTCSACSRGESPARMCRQCCDLPWRRPRKAACRCGQHWEAEPPQTIERFISEPRESVGV